MSTEPKILPDPQIDRGTAVVRGVCGALLGVVVACVFWIRCQGFGLLGSVLLFVASIAVCTLGAIRYGDEFWYGVLGRGR